MWSRGSGSRGSDLMTGRSVYKFVDAPLTNLSHLTTDRSRGPRKLIFAGKIRNKVERGLTPFKTFLVL